MDKKGIAWKYVVGIIIGLVILVILMVIVGRTGGHIKDLIAKLAEWL